MPVDFHPNLSMLRQSQRQLWSEFSEVPEEFVLCGGTAVALHLGHRESYDFELFVSQNFDPDTLLDSISFLRNSNVVQKANSTLTCLVDRSVPVKISFFGVPKIQLTDPPLIAPETKLKVASLRDLAGMKAAVVQKGAEAKDYIDMDALIRLGHIDLSTALAAGNAIYGAQFNPANTLKSLCFFADGDLPEISQEVEIDWLLR